MGKEKTTVVNQGTTQATETPKETELNNLALERQRAGQTSTLQSIGLMGNLTNQLLRGGQLPGYLQQLQTGIDPNTIATQAGVLQRQYMPQYQQGGIIDSGVMQRDIQKRLANELLLPTQQFNIGTYQQLLNQAMGGQAQVVGQQTQGAGVLGSQLAGLRQVNTSQNQTTQAMNPFLKSFQQSMGQSSSGAIWGGVGGLSKFL